MEPGFPAKAAAKTTSATKDRARQTTVSSITTFPYTSRAPGFAYFNVMGPGTDSPNEKQEALPHTDTIEHSVR